MMLSERKKDTKECVMHDFIFMKPEGKNEYIVTDVKIVVTSG